MVILRPEQSSLQEMLDRILDKGVVIDAEVRIGLGCADFLGIRATIILASFKTAIKIGLAFPEGTNFDTPAWQALISKQPCPVCGMELRQKDLKDEGCPWCGWNYRPKES
ncbi:MAG: gas vesicle protein [Candidatus Bathyarchaeota archaeon]|nr:gas vesicle protein [Candidatus Bathyarchaeota archaeon]